MHETGENKATPEDLNTIEKIDTYIASNYGGSLGNENDRTPPSGDGKLPSVFQYTGGVRMSSSGASNDCLIHSFLTSVSSSFRRLPSNDKDTVASFFRRKIYVHLLPKQTEEDKNRITGNDFLIDDDVLYLSKIYNVQILVFEGEKKGMKACTSIHFQSQGKQIYMLWNHDNLHFESVRDAVDGYAIKLNKALWLLQNTRCDTLHRCSFRTGDTVEYKGKPYKIAYIVIDPETQACLNFYLATEEQYVAYEAMPLDIKIEDDLEETMHFILADIHEVVRSAVGETRRRRQNPNKTRKTRR